MGTASPSRDRIIDAAMDVFSQSGYDGTTTKRIAEVAKVNEVTLFRIFGNKEALFNSMIEERFPASRIMAEVDFSADEGLEDLLFRNACLVLGILKENKKLFIILVNEMNRRPELRERLSRAVLKDSIGYLAKIFQRLMDEGKMRRTDPVIAARAWIGMVQSYFLFNHMFFSDGPDQEKDEQAIKGFITIFIEGVRCR